MEVVCHLIIDQAKRIMARIFTVFALLLVVMATQTMACSTPLTTAEFTQLYCNAGVVFVGEQSMASSGVATDENGRRIESGSFTFNVVHLYKGSSGDSQISVLHVWREGVNECPAGAFPDQASYFLVFASGSSYLKVDTCRHSFPWECVPADFKQSMPNVQC
ncbi:hypothetical protein RRG08_017257 [Elysia crispata]|uniref:Uncharacterized protein n=1 Tax=Elysia crispata TaxID=231223 RepID=A0AAE0Y0C8_9GAST|nr:hypothetical protein RRG08_017257 [Elysia crispata]